MSNRIRLTKPIVATRAEAEKLLGSIALDTLEKNQLTGELDRQLTEIRQRYEGRIDGLAKQIEQQTGLLQQWAEASPEEFGEKKSIEFLHGKLGFRTGTPKLKTIAGWTWEKIKAAVHPNFVRTKTEADKEAILAAYARDEINDKELKAIGIAVVQDESFFVEPKLEDPAGRIVMEASA